MTAVVLRVELTEQPIELSEHEALVAHHDRPEPSWDSPAWCAITTTGALSIRLEYSAHPRRSRLWRTWPPRSRPTSHGVRAIAVSHRIGTLQIGDAALVAAVAADHRGGGIRDVCPRWWTPSRRGYRCGSTSSSPTAPTSGSDPA